jgi:hypothetical protein
LPLLPVIKGLWNFLLFNVFAFLHHLIRSSPVFLSFAFRNSIQPLALDHWAQWAVLHCMWTQQHLDTEYLKQTKHWNETVKKVDQASEADLDNKIEEWRGRSTFSRPVATQTRPLRLHSVTSKTSNDASLLKRIRHQARYPSGSKDGIAH